MNLKNLFYCLIISFLTTACMKKEDIEKTRKLHYFNTCLKASPNSTPQSCKESVESLFNNNSKTIKNF